MNISKAEELFAERAINAAIRYLFRVEKLRAGDPRFDRLPTLLHEHAPEAFATTLREVGEAASLGMDLVANEVFMTDAMLCGVFVARLALQEKGA